uniref:CCHC-type domain-containing protein n=1 Tax=Tanacetum cinerariifolium TaxID=118510 RepID=A0A6L2MNG0_TANCI|nr:hypothetical protein [Tanacetum cinerariifolium]
MTFNQYKDAKSLFAAIETRFGGNEATKKTRNTLLKQMYENFSAPSTKSLDSILNRFHKIISQLAVLGEFISQEDLNLKFLRSLPSEWNTHVVVWRNKPDLDTMSIDDLYNNFKIVEQEVKGTASSNSSSQDMAFVSSSSTNSTNEVHTAYGVNTASTQSSTASTQLVHEDLEQIHEDKLEEMDLKWQLALLSMRAKRVFQKTRKKITINGSDTAGFDKSKVECYNCHKMGHFARECRGPRNQDTKNMYQDSSRRTVHVKKPLPKLWLLLMELVLTGAIWLKMSYGPKSCEIESKNASKDIPKKIKKYHDSPLVKDRVSHNKDWSVESPVVVEKKIVVPTIAKVEVVGPKQQEKPVRKTVRYAEMYMSQGPRGNIRNWNNLKSQQLGSNFVMYNKACFVCGSFDHLQAGCNYHQKERVVTGNIYTRVHYNYSTKKAHPNAHRNMVPRAVLIKIGLKPLNTVRLVNTAHPKTTVHSARPMSCFSEISPSTVRRPIQKKTALTNKSFHQKVNTAKGKVNTAMPKVVNTARPKAVYTARPRPAVVNAVRANQAIAVKASACWV